MPLEVEGAQPIDGVGQGDHRGDALVDLDQPEDAVPPVALTFYSFRTMIALGTVLMLVFGIAFQTPIAIFILVRTGLVSIPTLRRIRKYVILGTVIVAAVATPPDIISQMSLAIPLYGLYEVGIVLALFAQKKAKEKEQQSP